MRTSHPTSAESEMLLRFSEPSYQLSTPGQNTFGERVLADVDTMSRRMEDLAREFDCLGHFDDDDGPRAA